MRTALVVGPAGAELSVGGAWGDWEVVAVPDLRGARARAALGQTELVVASGPEDEVVVVLSWARSVLPAALRVLAAAPGDRVGGTAIVLSHQAVVAPLDDASCRELLDLVDWSLDLVRVATLRSLAAGLPGLLGSSRTLAELDALLSRCTTTMAEVAGLVATDTGLASRLLRLVNSPYFGIRRSVSDLTDAVSFLGLRTVRTLACGEAILAALGGSTDDPAIVRHLAHASATADLLASNVPPVERPDAFAAGLLHVAGSLALARLGVGHGARASHQPCARSELEEAALGASRAEIGAFLLLRWGLPLRVVAAVASMDRPDARPAGDLGHALAEACCASAAAAAA